MAPGVIALSPKDAIRIWTCAVLMCATELSSPGSSLWALAVAQGPCRVEGEALRVGPLQELQLLISASKRNASFWSIILEGRIIF